MSVAKPIESVGSIDIPSLARPYPQPRPNALGADGAPEPLDVTVVLPCYNEEDHVVAEVERICAAMDASGSPTSCS